MVEAGLLFLLRNKKIFITFDKNNSHEE